MPSQNKIRGTRICRQTKGDWSNEWKRCHHPRGGSYFWLTGAYTNQEKESQDTDQWALSNGYLAITPIQVDMTAYAFMEELNKWNVEL
jgi:5'-nucleotidase